MITPWVVNAFIVASLMPFMGSVLGKLTDFIHFPKVYNRAKVILFDSPNKEAA
jgi:hypothetical protein